MSDSKRTRKIVGVIRVSTAAQAGADRHSIPAQKATIEEIARANGAVVGWWIEVEDVSGTSVMKSPEYKRMFSIMERPDCYGVAAREFSRVVRPVDPADYVLLSIFIRTETRLLLPSGEFDLTKSEHRIMALLLGEFAAKELEEFKRKIWLSKERARAEGKCPTNAEVACPRGVWYTKERGWHYTADSIRVRKAFEMLLAGEHNYAKLSKVVGCAQGSLRKILSNPIYIGWRVVDRKVDSSLAGKIDSADARQGYRKKIARDANEIIRIKVIDDPLVSESDFAKAQAIISAKYDRRLRASGTMAKKFLYTGFLTCGECGSKIYPMGRGAARFGNYVCKNRTTAFRKQGANCCSHYMGQMRLEAILDEVIETKLTDRAFLETLLRKLQANDEKKLSAKSVSRMKFDVAALEDKRGRILDNYEDGLISKARRDAKLAEIDESIRLINVELFKDAKPSAPALTIDELETYFLPLQDWNFLSYSERREVLSKLNPEIVVSDYAVKGIAILNLASDDGADDGSGLPRVISRERERTSSCSGNFGNTCVESPALPISPSGQRRPFR